MSENNELSHFDQEALRFHNRDGVPGKVSVKPTKPLLTQRDLALLMPRCCCSLFGNRRRPSGLLMNIQRKEMWLQ